MIHDEFTALPLSHQHKLQLRRHRDGRCVSCGAPCLPYRMCAKHRVSRNARIHNPQKYDARRAVSAALARGDLVRGSCWCGKLGFAHHKDYSRPLEITWLCHQHHTELHGGKATVEIELRPRDYKAEKREYAKRRYLAKKQRAAA